MVNSINKIIFEKKKDPVIKVKQVGTKGLKDQRSCKLN